MAIILTKANLKESLRKAKIAKQMLPASLMFTDKEKMDVANALDELIAIYKNVLDRQPINL